MERYDRNSEICVDVPLHGGLVEVDWESLLFRLKIEDIDEDQMKGFGASRKPARDEKKSDHRGHRGGSWVEVERWFWILDQ